MGIIFDKEKKIFHLQAGNCSYVMQVIKEKYLVHLYWGKRIKEYKESRKIIWKDRGFAPNPDKFDRTFSLDTLPQEYPQAGNGDFRSSAYSILDSEGRRISDLSYEGYEIVKGKELLTGLPCTFGTEEEVQTLKIHMMDKVLNLFVILKYSVFENESVITRSVEFRNCAKDPIRLTKMLSMSLDIREDDFDVLTLYGAHNNERNMDRRALTSGTISIESIRGTSSPQQSPFMALLRRGANEDYGEIYSANFIYSGNFIASAQVDSYRNVRFQMGMNPWNGDWFLEANEEFQTPEVVMVYAQNGLNEMSHIYHRFYQKHLIRSLWKEKERPILINNWEATFFDFNEEKLLRLADKAKQVGIELFVLDDGWFGKRNSDESSLGDWVVDRAKLPNGLAYLSDEIHKRGMKFGIWVEPEMISEESNLFQQHPEYVLHTKNRPYSYGRGQFVLDLTKKEVREYVVHSIIDVLKSAKIEYVKWDMNRHLTEVSSDAFPKERQGEIYHRYVLGLYEIMERITKEFPDILFESCSSGGGRFDAGMLYYMPQTWCSDNTDAVCRMKIQYATSLMFPAIIVGAHVSMVPNQQTGRVTPLKTRGYVAMSANFGYELDLTQCEEEELEEIKEQIKFYKRIRSIIQFGTLYRIKNPFESNCVEWNFISQDKKEVVAFYFEVLSQPASSVKILKLKGLEVDASYQNVITGEVYGGDELMYSGISIPLKKEDFRSEYYYFKKV